MTTRRFVTVALWTVAAAVVVVAVWAELDRPLAATLPPTDLVEVGVPPGVVQTAQAYRDGQTLLTLTSVALRLAVGLAALSPPVRRRAAGLVRTITDARARTGRRAARPVIAAGLGLAVWAVSDLVRLPVQLLGWQRAVDVGLSTQDLAGWLRDWAVTTIPYWLGVAIVVALVAWLVEVAPRTWVPTAGLLVGSAGVVVILLSPLLLEPLVLSFRPLQDEALSAEIEVLADRALGEPPEEILVADASRRTTASNAYVSGLVGTRRIVLYDTLLRDAADPEVLAIVAHELAHDANRDLERTAAAVMATAVLAMLALDVAFGRRLRDIDGRVRPALAVPIVGLTIVLAIAVTPLERWSSRRAETAADAIALRLTGDGETFVDMMAGLAERNLSNPDPPEWLVTLFYTHPPTPERITRGLQQ